MRFLSDIYLDFDTSHRQCIQHEHFTKVDSDGLKLN